MIAHTTVGSHDLAAAKAFYDAVMPEIGWQVAYADFDAGWLGYTRTHGTLAFEFLVCRPINGEPATAGNGVTIGLQAPTPASVHGFYEKGLAAGGRSEGAPGRRAEYFPGFYGAYLRDPSGNKICCVCNIAAQEQSASQ